MPKQSNLLNLLDTASEIHLLHLQSKMLKYSFKNLLNTASEIHCESDHEINKDVVEGDVNEYMKVTFHSHGPWNDLHGFFSWNSWNFHKTTVHSEYCSIIEYSGF